MVRVSLNPHGGAGSKRGLWSLTHVDPFSSMKTACVPSTKTGNVEWRSHNTRVGSPGRGQVPNGVDRRRQPRRSQPGATGVETE